MKEIFKSSQTFPLWDKQALDVTLRVKSVTLISQSQ